jgi:acylphosphatase
MPDPSPSSDTGRLVAEVRGRVQGVGFRHFTRSTARRLGLAGFVRNDPDGSVTVVAEGSRGALDALVDALREGPDSAEVESVETAWESPRDAFEAFSVAYH